MTLQAASINRKELFLRACRGEVLPRVPVWMMRQAGRYLPEYREIRAKHAFLEVCKTPDLAVEVSLQPLRRLDVDAVIVFSDILIVAEAMGLHLELGDAGPNLPQPVRSEADVRKLKTFDPETETGFLMEAIRRLVREVGPTVPVLGFAAAPWTLASYMVEGKTKEGFATVKGFMYAEPRTFRELLGRISQATISYLQAQIRAGAAAVQLFDTWCGELNLRELRRTLGPKIALQGNLDPAVLFAPEETIRRVTQDTVATLGGVGHILNLGHCILQHTPVENAKIFVETGQHAQFANETNAAVPSR